MAITFGTDKQKNIYGKELSSPIGRAAFVFLKTARVNPAYPNNAPRRSISILFPKDDPTLKENFKALQAMVSAMVVQRDGPKAGKFKLAKPMFQDGDAMDTEKYPELAGNHVMSASTTGMPELIDRDTKIIAPEEIQSGQRIRIMYVPMLLPANKVAFRLSAVQTAKDDGVRFFGGPRAASFLGALEADGPEFEDPENPKESDMSVEDAAVAVFGGSAQAPEAKKTRKPRTEKKEVAAVRPTPVADQGEFTEEAADEKALALDVV